MKMQSIHRLRNNFIVAILGAFLGAIFHNNLIAEFSVLGISSLHIVTTLFALAAMVILEIYRERKEKPLP